MVKRPGLTTAVLLMFSIISGEEGKLLTLSDIFISEKFSGKTISDIQWSGDGSSFSYINELNQIIRHEVKTGTETVLVNGAVIESDGEPIEITGYEISRDQNRVLITGKREKIWRRSFSAPIFLYDLKKKKLTVLEKGNPELRNATLSPNGTSVAYILDNDLHVMPVPGSNPRKLTSDGSDNILNGLFDWVYEEEFGRADAYRWSPDGKGIAFWRTDQSGVKTFLLLDELSSYSVPTRISYPKVGQRNAKVSIGVVDTETGRTTWMDIGDEQDIYIPRIDWADSSETVAIQRLNRRQNRLELLIGDATTGRMEVVMTDTDSAWVDVTDDVIFLADGKQFVWTSEMSGFRHIYLTNLESGDTERVTRGDWEVSSIAGVDEERQWVYFYGKKESPLEQHIYRVKLSGRRLQRISREPGWHTAEYSTDFGHFVHFYSNARRPTRIVLRESDGTEVRVLVENVVEAFEEYAMVYPEFVTVKTGDGVELNGSIMKPADFSSGRKYPVLVNGYGGPGSQRVVDRWGGKRQLWHQLMMEKGYIVFSLDNRGTGGRGKGFKNLAHGDISKWAVADQIEGAKFLAGLPYVDPGRIGFWGWSGGGYLACMLMTRAADEFKTGVAVAPVTDLRNYDTIWTERYMGLLGENEQGYDSANVMSYADRLRGNLLIIHGTADDNVHPVNTIQLVNALIQENKQFDLMLYPNRNHSISGEGTRLHLYTLITDYILENL